MKTFGIGILLFFIVNSVYSQGKKCSILRFDFSTIQIDTIKKAKVLKITCTVKGVNFVDTLQFSSAHSCKDIEVPKGKVSVKIESDFFEEYSILDIQSKCNHIVFLKVDLIAFKKGKKPKKK